MSTQTHSEIREGLVTVYPGGSHDAQPQPQPGIFNPVLGIEYSASSPSSSSSSGLHRPTPVTKKRENPRLMNGTGDLLSHTLTHSLLSGLSVCVSLSPRSLDLALSKDPPLPPSPSPSLSPPLCLSVCLSVSFSSLSCSLERPTTIFFRQQILIFTERKHVCK
jgi:hypothetical protein